MPELASIKELDNSLLLTTYTKNIQKLKRFAPGEINLQSEQDLICHMVKVKAAMSAHYKDERHTFSSIFIIPFACNASINQKKMYFTTIKKTISNKRPKKKHG